MIGSIVAPSRISQAADRFGRRQGRRAARRRDGARAARGAGPRRRRRSPGERRSPDARSRRPAKRGTRRRSPSPPRAARPEEDTQPVSQNRREKIDRFRKPTARRTPISRVRSCTPPITVTSTMSPPISSTIAETPNPRRRSWSTAAFRLSTTWRIADTLRAGQHLPDLRDDVLHGAILAQRRHLEIRHGPRPSRQRLHVRDVGDDHPVLLLPRRLKHPGDAERRGSRRSRSPPAPCRAAPRPRRPAPLLRASGPATPRIFHHGRASATSAAGSPIQTMFFPEASAAVIRKGTIGCGSGPCGGSTRCAPCPPS